MRIALRLATAADAPGIAEVLVATWASTYGEALTAAHLAGRSVAGLATDWATAVEVDPTVVAVDADAGAIIGFAQTCRSRDPGADAHEGELAAIYVRRSWNGLGVGRALLAAAVEVLRVMGLTEAVLWVQATNVRAQRFYRAAGWRADGAVRAEPIGDRRVVVVRYRRALR